MNIYYENLFEFKAWSGAIPLYEFLNNHKLLGLLEANLDELYPDGINETELNDLLWFEPEFILVLVGKTIEEWESEL